MKKVILTVCVAGALLATSCKKAKEAGSDVVNATEKVAGEATEAVKEGADKVVDGAKEMADKAGDMLESAIEGVAIPKFEDAKVGEHLKAYSEYAKEYIAAGKDAYKNAALMSKGKDLLAKGKEILGSLDAESAKKFQGVMSAIQSKMAPAK